MKKLVQINPVLRSTTSTGKIMKEIASLASSCGWECHLAYSGGRERGVRSKFGLMPVGGRLSVALHGILTRLTDRHGLCSSMATRRFVRQLEKLDPDVIHIHNIHGYFLNYKILFDYLRRSGKPVIWTVHDCWLFTGHCYHYASAGCDRWKTGCGHCPQRKAFPASWFIDRSEKNYRDKRAAFTSIGDKLTIVTVSEWMREQMSESFLKECRFKVIHNGIDTNRFRPCDPSRFIRDHKLEGRKILLGVASIWSREKGLDDFAGLAGMLEDEEVLVLVGLSDAQAAGLPDSIINIPRTSDIEELAEIYSAATVFVNLTHQENYPTVQMEAISCGTPVVTYDTGGCRESIVGETGTVVPQGDKSVVLKAVRAWEAEEREKTKDACRSYALSHFRKEDRYEDYIRLYEELTR